MKTILAPRASALLYELLIARNDRRRFLLPANICPIVPLTFLKANVPFEFVDISPVSLHMDLDAAEALLASHRRDLGGMLYAHTYGDPATPHEFFNRVKAQFPDLLLIDDRCLCIPDLELDGSSAADVILYSTGRAKVVDLGFGGLAFVQEHVPHSHRSLPFDPQTLGAFEKEYKGIVGARSPRPQPYVDGNWLQTDGVAGLCSTRSRS